ncbi:MAG: GNAT family N-acetyltransferase [Verrucomicrobiales bacterium]|jgi:putative acetyltransferase|nr:GNAT family N-acetyltransferase [Verrucomicrobiales bacterium]
MTLRPATSADREVIEALIFGILRDYGLEPSPETTDADLADIAAHYSGNRGSFDVMESDEGRIIGTVAVHRTGDDLCELRKMYLAKELRGQGWGKRLLDHAIESGRKLGYRTMWLETADSLKESHRLYELYGFQSFVPPHQSDRCDFSMKRDL